MRDFLLEINRDMELEERVLAHAETELKKLPLGQLKQSGQGKGIYVKDKGRYKSAAKNSYLVEQIRRRKLLEMKREIIQVNLHWQKKLIAHYKSYSDEDIESMLSQSYRTRQEESADEIHRIPLNNSVTYHEEGLMHRTASGELRRSKSEVIISMILDAYSVNYTYEERLYWPFAMSWEAEKFKEAAGLPNSVLPDFTIFLPDGERLYWEHLGLLNKPGYAEEWMKKMLFYHWIGVDQGRNLIVTADSSDGHLEQQPIAEIVRTQILKK